MKKPKYRVAFYCRVANADQLSLEHQENVLKNYAEEHGYSNCVSYLDNGYSGLNFDRPEFTKLNADIQAGKINTVIVRNETRIGRNLIQVEDWIDDVGKRGVSVITTDYPRNKDFSNNFRQMITAAMRSYKGARTSKKSKGKA